MFGILKKKLKESIGRISKAVKKETTIEDIEDATQEVMKEPEEVVEIEIKKEKDVVGEFEEEIREEAEEQEENEIISVEEAETAEEMKEPAIKEISARTEVIIRKVSKKEPKGIFEKVKKKISEKKIKEEDIKDILWDMQISLIQSDVAVEVAEKIVKNLKNDLVGQSAKRGKVEEMIKKSLESSILDIMNIDGFDFITKVKSKKPFLIVFLGFNGSGKTTTVARIGKMLADKHFKCVLAAADTWRAASIEQLEEHGNNLGLKVIKQKYKSDPAAVIFDAVKHANAKGIDVVLADTAGRSHANTNLMDELKKIIRVNTPDLKILVLDALTGNDIYDQCKLFNEAVGVDGLIITKADVYDKGGAALSAAHTIGKPLLFLGIGQEYDKLVPFNAKDIVNSLFS